MQCPAIQGRYGAAADVESSGCWTLCGQPAVLQQHVLWPADWLGHHGQPSGTLLPVPIQTRIWQHLLAAACRLPSTAQPSYSGRAIRAPGLVHEQVQGSALCAVKPHGHLCKRDAASVPVGCMLLQSAVLGFGVFRVLERYGITSGLSVAENVILQTTSVATATMPLAAGQQHIAPLQQLLTAHYTAWAKMSCACTAETHVMAWAKMACRCTAEQEVEGAGGVHEGGTLCGLAAQTFLGRSSRKWESMTCCDTSSSPLVRHCSRPAACC